jgi:hypothetical protein
MMTVTNRKAEDVDAILAPVRRDFEESSMTDEDLAALVEEVREDIWREQHGQPSKTQAPPENTPA